MEGGVEKNRVERERERESVKLSYLNVFLWEEEGGIWRGLEVF